MTLEQVQKKVNELVACDANPERGYGEEEELRLKLMTEFLQFLVHDYYLQPHTLAEYMEIIKEIL